MRNSHTKGTLKQVAAKCTSKHYVTGNQDETVQLWLAAALPAGDKLQPRLCPSPP